MSDTAAAEEMVPWPADNPERRAIAELIPYANNPMTHSPEQVEQLAASMRRFGWTNPVLIDEEGGIIAGHGRVMAAMKLGIEHVPVIVAKGWTEAEKRAYLLADNQLGRIGVWDRELLKVEIGEINALAPELLSLTGFADLELVEFISGLPGNQPGQAPIDVAKTLAERFGVPPFSVLVAREGWWQDRKRAWIGLGIQSELGRGENLIGRSPQELFCHLTGIKYDEARKIVTDAMAEQGEAFDLHALVAKHGGRKHDAIPGGAGRNSVYRDRDNLGRKIDGAQRLPAKGKGGLVQRMAAGEGTKRAVLGGEV